MDNQIRMGGFNILPPGVKNLLILNILVFLSTYIFHTTGLCDLNKWLGLHYITAPDFKPWQFITYMFMHANFGHIFFNMFALWMFGAAVESHWGTKRFIIYYLITGIGAALVHYVILFFQLHPMLSLLNQFINSPSIDTYKYLVENNTNLQFKEMLDNNLLYLQQNPGSINELVNITANARDTFLNSFNMVGASGAVFGLLLAFGMMFPNSQIYIYFLFPIKAKWFVVFYGALELFYGIAGTSDGVAHFAHLGGMLFGIILILLWRKTDRHSNTYYYDYQDPEGHSGFFSRFQSLFHRTKKKREKYYVSTPGERPLSDEEYNERKAAERRRIDDILDKISKSGYESLSKEEKDILFNFSKK